MRKCLWWGVRTLRIDLNEFQTFFRLHGESLRHVRSFLSRVWSFFSFKRLFCQNAFKMIQNQSHFRSNFRFIFGQNQIDFGSKLFKKFLIASNSYIIRLSKKLFFQNLEICDGLNSVRKNLQIIRATVKISAILHSCLLVRMSADCINNCPVNFASTGKRFECMP